MKVLGLLLSFVLLAAACNRVSQGPVLQVPNGDPQAGATLIRQWGCGSCHTIPGVDGAQGLVGPPLAEFGSRAYIAGQLSNNPDNLIRWIMDPQGVEPGTAMPNMNVSEGAARHMAAYLYTLRR
jgi:cytochrome c1